jgi:hypothetical protein
MFGAVLATMVLTFLLPAPWAKLAMALQSLVSLAILALVVARAVNVFT